MACAAVLAPWTIRNLRTYDRFVLIASEGGVTFWTGNHPLARGEGDLAANPDLKVAELAFRAAHPGLSAEALEPLYYSDAIGWIRSSPAAWVSLELRKLFYLVVPIGPSYALHSASYRAASDDSVSDRAAAALVGRRGAPRHARAGRDGSPRRLGRHHESRVLSAGAFPYSDHRSSADCRGVRARGEATIVTAPRVLVVVPTYNEKDNLPLVAEGVLAHRTSA